MDRRRVTFDPHLYGIIGEEKIYGGKKEKSGQTTGIKKQKDT